jgi:hypothetical protein
MKLILTIIAVAVGMVQPSPAVPINRLCLLRAGRLL